MVGKRVRRFAVFFCLRKLGDGQAEEEIDDTSQQRGDGIIRIEKVGEEESCFIYSERREVDLGGAWKHSLDEVFTPEMDISSSRRRDNSFDYPGSLLSTFDYVLKLLINA